MTALLRRLIEKDIELRLAQAQASNHPPTNLPAELHPRSVGDYIEVAGDAAQAPAVMGLTFVSTAFALVAGLPPLVTGLIFATAVPVLLGVTFQAFAAANDPGGYVSRKLVRVQFRGQRRGGLSYFSFLALVQNAVSLLLVLVFVD